MSVDHVVAVVPVSDIATAEAFYQRLFDRPADNNPMPNLVEWQVTGNGWVQVFEDRDRAGHTLLNLAVDDLDGHLAGLTARDLAPEPVQEASKGVRLSGITDPDGNRITFVGGFRVRY